MSDNSTLTEFDALKDSITQREWLLVCSKLDVTRNKIDADYGLLLLACAWVKEKREHGGVSWDRLLDMSDAEILDVLGIRDDEADEADERQDNPDSEPDSLPEAE